MHPTYRSNLDEADQNLFPRNNQVAQQPAGSSPSTNVHSVKAVDTETGDKASSDKENQVINGVVYWSADIARGGQGGSEWPVLERHAAFHGEVWVSLYQLPDILVATHEMLHYLYAQPPIGHQNPQILHPYVANKDCWLSPHGRLLATYACFTTTIIMHLTLGNRSHRILV